jgi:hypothetical protein
MKTPRFEELAQRWAGKAEVYFVFSEEAHPRAAANDRLNGFASQLASLDKNHDNEVTLAEYGTFGPRFMFDAFDLDHDGIVKSHELLAARRIEQFRDVDEATTLEQRVALAKRFRAEVPGKIRVLIDTIDNRTGNAYGGLPNSAYVIARGGKVTTKLAWAAVHDVDAELARLTGTTAPVVRTPDFTPIAQELAAAKTANRRLLLELVAPGCPACTHMDETTLADADVQTAMQRFSVARHGIEHDDMWRLFEDLDLAATPAFVIITPDGRIAAQAQGYHDPSSFLGFLR